MEIIWGVIALFALWQHLPTTKDDQSFFTRELIAVLKLMDKKTIPFDATGSWAGAMGAVQFMPTNVIAYGVDANNDGKVDLWNEKADIYASAANFLNKLGWEKMKNGEGKP